MHQILLYFLLKICIKIKYQLVIITISLYTIGIKLIILFYFIYFKYDNIYYFIIIYFKEILEVLTLSN